VIVQDACDAPAGIVTIGGGYATVGSELVIVTVVSATTGPVINRWFPDDDVPPSNVVANRPINHRLAGPTRIVSVSVVPSQDAVIATGDSDATGLVAIGNVALLDPGAITTELGTVAALPETDSAIVSGEFAGFASATVPVAGCPPVTERGDSTSDIACGGTKRTLAVRDVVPAIPEIAAVIGVSP
jgi:hypothetical protein